MASAAVARCVTFYDAYEAFKAAKETTQYECEHDGRIMFLPYDLVQRTDTVAIHVVEVKTPRQGVFTRFIMRLAEDPTLQTITVCGVSTSHMVACLKRLGETYGMPFMDHGGDFVWTRPKK